jgi:hypothetical protein
VGYQIEVDFDVYKQLTWERQTEAEDYNAVLRRLLKLPPKATNTETTSISSGQPLVVKGVTFPAGTEFRAKYHGATYTAMVQDGALLIDGKKFYSPSPAAMYVAKGISTNGWAFWECKRPGDKNFTPIDRLRKS